MMLLINNYTLLLSLENQEIDQIIGLKSFLINSKKEKKT